MCLKVLSSILQSFIGFVTFVEKPDPLTTPYRSNLTSAADFD
jgi:hypothetical protein